MDLIITSAWRAENQKTIKVLPDKWLAKTTLLVPKDQKKEYKKYGIRVIGHDRYGMSATRQWVLDHSTEFSQYVVLLDDDLNFMIRKDGKLKTATEKEVGQMFELLQYWMVEDNFANVGVSPRAGNNHVTEDYAECTRVMRVFGFNTKIALKVGARFDRAMCMSDYDMTLQLLEAGYPNRVSYKYANGQPSSNTKGGCSVYRTPEVLKTAAETMAKLHPGIVKVVLRKTEKPWEGFDSKWRTDAKVFWKKAFLSGSKKTNQTSISKFFK